MRQRSRGSARAISNVSNQGAVLDDSVKHPEYAGFRIREMKMTRFQAAGRGFPFQHPRACRKCSISGPVTCSWTGPRSFACAAKGEKNVFVRCEEGCPVARASGYVGGCPRESPVDRVWLRLARIHAATPCQQRMPNIFLLT